MLLKLKDVVLYTYRRPPPAGGAAGYWGPMSSGGYNSSRGGQWGPQNPPSRHGPSDPYSRYPDRNQPRDSRRVRFVCKITRSRVKLILLRKKI